MVEYRRSDDSRTHDVTEPSPAESLADELELVSWSTRQFGLRQNGPGPSSKLCGALTPSIPGEDNDGGSRTSEVRSIAASNHSDKEVMSVVFSSHTSSVAQLPCDKSLHSSEGSDSSPAVEDDKSDHTPGLPSGLSKRLHKNHLREFECSDATDCFTPAGVSREAKIEANSLTSLIRSTPLTCESLDSLSRTESQVAVADRVVANKLAADAEFLENTFKDEDLIVSISEQPEVQTTSMLNHHASDEKTRSQYDIENRGSIARKPVSLMNSLDLVATVSTTVHNKEVSIDWAAKTVTVNGIAVRFENSRLRCMWLVSSPLHLQMVKEWRVLLQMRTYSIWTVTLCLPDNDTSTSILSRLSSALNYKEFVRAPSMAQCVFDQRLSCTDRPHIGQLTINFDPQLCRQHSNGQNIPREFASELSKQFGFRSDRPWLFKLCYVEPERFGELAIDMSERPQRNYIHRNMPSCVEQSADEVYALRSLLLIASPIGCKKHQMRLSARVVAQLTGNNDCFSNFGYYDSYEADVFGEYLNSRRPSNIKPVIGYTASLLEPTFVSADDPIPPHRSIDWASIKTQDLECRVSKISGFFQSALRGLTQNQVSQNARSGLPRISDPKPNEAIMSCQRAPNSAELVGNPQLDINDSACREYLKPFKFPHVQTGGVQSIFGVYLGRARAMMSLIERGTSHHALILHTNNIKLGLIELMGLDKSLMHRFSIPAAAIIPIVLGLDGLVYMILGDAGATLTKVCDTLTFSPVVEDDRDPLDSASHRVKLLSSDVPRDFRQGHPKLDLSAVGKRIILLRHGQNYQRDDCDLGLTDLGRRQLCSTAEWLSDCLAMKRSLLGSPKYWTIAGLATDDCQIRRSMRESLELVRNIFISGLPLSASEMTFANESGNYEPENIFLARSNETESCDLHVLISDEYHLLKYFGLCFGIDPASLKFMRIPHAGFIAININATDNFAWCPTFGMVAHIPPALVCSANHFFS